MVTMKRITDHTYNVDMLNMVSMKRITDQTHNEDMAFRIRN